jgi:hypothetical protein
MPLPIDSSVEAEYADGYIHSETDLEDVSSFKLNANVFYDILNNLLEPEHGRLVRFSCFWKDQRYDIDWRDLPDNARPIRFRHGYSKMNMAGQILESGFSGVDFGYQWNDESGANHQEVLELR